MKLKVREVLSGVSGVQLEVCGGTSRSIMTAASQSRISPSLL